MKLKDDNFLYKQVKSALKEDIGKGDVTTASIIPKDATVKAHLLAKEDCVICGLAVVELVLGLIDKRVKFRSLVKEGRFVKKGKVFAKIEGRARSILTAERVALNFLSRLSGIATKTRKFTDKIKPYRVKILDTRKTTPNLRLLEKYAVRIGGGYNHRLSLDEMIMVKDNHFKVLGDIKKLAKLRRRYQLEIEVNNLNEFKHALSLKPDIIMLDNMSTANIKKAVKLRGTKKVRLEVSGGVNINNIREIARTGVDTISIGALTHSARSVDISLEIV